jgi:segregation and condensation protein A
MVSNEFSLENFESSPLYLAYKLVEEGKIDPWDVDLEKLLNAYLEEIRRRQILDLRIPARIVAFATYLVKKQLEILFPKPPRPKTPRKVTLKEIEEEFESFEVEQLIEEKPKKVVKRKSTTKRAKKEKPKLEPPLHKAKLEEVLEYLLQLLEEIEPNRKMDFFSFATKGDYVAKLLALLNLTYEGKVDMEQEKPFGNIYFWKI